MPGFQPRFPVRDRAKRTLVPALVSVLCLGVPATAMAGSTTAQASGAARAIVVPPIGIVAVEDLRFGSFMQPTSNGNISIDPDGTIQTAGGMVGMEAISQIGTGRGPGSFLVRGDPNRRFDVTLPVQFDIANGAATMRVFNMKSSLPGPGTRLDATGSYLVRVGARLTVKSGQAYGSYSGTYTMTVTYQ